MNALNRNFDRAFTNNELITKDELQRAEKYKTKNSTIEKIVDLVSCCVTTPCFPCFLGLSNLNQACTGGLVCCSGACIAATCCAPVSCLACFFDQEEMCCDAVRCCVNQINKSCGIPPINDSNFENNVPYEAEDVFDNCTYAVCSGHFWAKRGICTQPIPIGKNAFLMPSERNFVERIETLRQPTDIAFSSISNALNTPSSARINDPEVTLLIADYLNPTLANQMAILNNIPRPQRMN